MREERQKRPHDPGTFVCSVNLWLFVSDSLICFLMDQVLWPMSKFSSVSARLKLQ